MIGEPGGLIVAIANVGIRTMQTEEATVGGQASPEDHIGGFVKTRAEAAKRLAPTHMKRQSSRIETESDDQMTRSLNRAVHTCCR